MQDRLENQRSRVARALQLGLSQGEAMYFRTVIGAATTRAAVLSFPVVLPLVAGLVTGCDGHVSEAKAAAVDPAVHAEAVTVAERTIPRRVRLTGTLEAN